VRATVPDHGERMADAAIGSDGEKPGAVVLLDEGRPPAAGAQAVLRLAAVAALNLAALNDATADGPRAAAALLEDLRRAPMKRETLVARARRLGVDLAGGAVALRVAARASDGSDAAAAAIPSHRHTVAYRLDRLRELTGLHPGSADDRERLGLGVKARLVLDALTEVR
jgi:sugar diacid utilization regulator